MVHFQCPSPTHRSFKRGSSAIRSDCSLRLILHSTPLTDSRSSFLHPCSSDPNNGAKSQKLESRRASLPSGKHYCRTGLSVGKPPSLELLVCFHLCSCATRQHCLSEMMNGGNCLAWQASCKVSRMSLLRNRPHQCVMNRNGLHEHFNSSIPPLPCLRIQSLLDTTQSNGRHG